MPVFTKAVQSWYTGGPIQNYYIDIDKIVSVVEDGTPGVCSMSFVNKFPGTNDLGSAWEITYENMMSLIKEARPDDFRFVVFELPLHARIAINVDHVALLTQAATLTPDGKNYTVMTLSNGLSENILGTPESIIEAFTRKPVVTNPLKPVTPLPVSINTK